MKTHIARVLIVTSLIAGVTPLATAHAAPTPYPDDLTFVVAGGGWGHGHGMSQYGARAAAEDGLTHEQILAHYYSGVSLADKGDPRMRVLLSSAPAVVVGGPEVVTGRWGDGSVAHTTSSDYPYVRARATDAGITLYRGASPDGPWKTVASGTGKVRFSAKDTVAVPVWRSGRIEYFRSVIEAYRRSATSMYLINDLRLNAYLYGVVPREMPASWPHRALRAQAIAARSYSLWKRGSVGRGASYHICATTSCQVYRGYGVRASVSAPLEVLEHPRTNAAIDATRGVTMIDPAEGPIFAEYNSSSGGHTAQGSRSYLAPVPDPYDERYSPYHRWSASVSVSQIVRRWPELGKLARIRIPSRDGHGPFGGRVQTMKLVGTDRTVTVSGDTFRMAMGLRSTLFDIQIYDAEQALPAPEVALAPGTSASAEVLVKNTGTAPWPVGTEVQLGTHPRNRTSAFADSSWLSPTRPSGLTADASDANEVVEPGQTALIRFTLRAPSDAVAGTSTERFRMVVPGATWFGSVISVPVRVGFDGTSHLGGNLPENPSFEALEGSAVAAWRGIAGTAPRASVTAIDGTHSLELRTSPKRWARARQSIQRRGRPGQRFVLSAWHGATRSGTSFVRAVLNNADGSTTRATLRFPSDAHPWTHGETALVATKRFRSITITLAGKGPSGSVRFDRVGLVRQDLVNGGFESGGAAWTVTNAQATDGPSRRIARQGMQSLRLSGRDGVASARQHVAGVRGPAGSRVRVGAWSRAVGLSPDAGAVQLRVRLHLGDGRTRTRVLDLPRADHDWAYSERTIEAPAAFRGVDIYAWVADQSGQVWFDDVVLARGRAQASVTANPGFELGSPAPGMWKVGAAGPGTVMRASAEGSSALRVSGAPRRNRHARQLIPIGGSAGERFAVSAWNKISDSDRKGGPVQIVVRVLNADGTSSVHRMDFSRRAHDWVHRERTFVAAKPFVRVQVFARFARQTGAAWFDEIRVQRAL